jgi:putative glutamine amidotransferase
MNRITIGITNCGRYDNYANWIKDTETVHLIRLTYGDDSFSMIDQCDGIVLTGGQDVHPRFFNKLEYMDFYKDSTPDIDEKRDVMELQVLKYSQANNLPLLGICRGLQITNVFFGGTLVMDIPVMGKRNHSKIREGEDRYHSISVTAGSALEKITGKSTGIVNSAHHQSALTIAPNLVVNALSEDGVVEGLERKDFYGNPYLMLVQWHPERMNDQQSVFSLNIRNSFLDAVRAAVPVK